MDKLPFFGLSRVGLWPAQESAGSHAHDFITFETEFYSQYRKQSKNIFISIDIPQFLALYILPPFFLLYVFV